MIIGFNLDTLTNNSFKFAKDNKEYLKKVRRVEFDPQTKEILTALNESKHEIFMLSPTPVELNEIERLKVKKELIRKLEKIGVDFARVAVIDENDMVSAVRRNHIDISVDNNTENLNLESEFTDTVQGEEDFNKMLANIFDNIEENRKAVLSYDVEPNGLPSEDQLWRKDYRVGDYKWNNEQMSPYDRLLSSSVDWLDEIAMEFNPIWSMLPPTTPDYIYNMFKKTYTYRDFFHEVDKLADSMRKAGIKKGVRVPVVLVNTPESFITLYALYQVKATIAPIFPLEKVPAFKDKIAKINELNAENGINTNYIFASDLVLGKLQEVIPDNFNVVSIPVTNSMAAPLKVAFEKVVLPKLGVKPVNYNEKIVKYNDFIAKDKDYVARTDKEYREYVNSIKREYDNSYAAVQLYTGGSIRAKGVNLSEENIDAATKQFYNDRFDFRRGDKIAAFMPLNHSFGLIIGTHVAASLGVDLDVIMKIDFKKLHNLFLKDGINIMGGIPNMFPNMINDEYLQNAKDLPERTYILSGGAAPDETIKNDVTNLLRNADAGREDDDIFHDGYGQTETAGGIIYDGIPNMGTNVKIVEPGTTNELGYEQIGELCINGPQVMQGYTEEELNSNALQRHADGQIWLHTGDYAMIHTNGRVQYVDRSDRMIKVNGEQVYLNHIEEEINKLPFVERSAVVRRKDDVRGTVPIAYIKLKPNVVYNSEIEEQINKYYSETFNSSTRPRGTKIIDEIPVTTVGKVDFIKLENQAQEEYENQKHR